MLIPIRAATCALTLCWMLCLTFGLTGTIVADDATVATTFEVTSDERDGCRRDSFTVHSERMDRDVAVRVVLPPGYDATADKRYPILYCLHGMGAPFATYSDMDTLRQALAEQPTILAMFDGGRGSFYLDAVGDGDVPKGVLYREPKSSESNDSDENSAAIKRWEARPDRMPSQYTHFFFEEFVPAVDSAYRVDRSNRAITGFSMGGFGAMHLMLEKPAFFRSVSGLSSAFYSREGLERRVGRGGGFFPSILGDYSPDALAYEKVLQMERIERLTESGVKLPPVYQHCGNEDRLLTSNWIMAESLRKSGCAVEFRSSPGRHNWDFWRDSSTACLDFHFKHFQP